MQSHTLAAGRAHSRDEDSSSPQARHVVPKSAIVRLVSHRGQYAAVVFPLAPGSDASDLDEPALSLASPVDW